MIGVLLAATPNDLLWKHIQNPPNTGDYTTYCAAWFIQCLVFGFLAGLFWRWLIVRF